ncbi:MAG: flippase-like domain-containing protein [Flavobacteriales bacterium]|nr:flippase-like domain-containing protein [Flavobacteriales bacterium]
MNLSQLIPKARWQDVIGLGISGLLFWLTFRNTSSEIWNLRLTPGQLCLLSVSMLSFVLTTAVQAYRMRWFIANDGRPMSSSSAFSSLYIGGFYNALLPGNLGELVKGRHFAMKNRIHFSTAMACWVAEKFADGITMAVLATVLLLSPLESTPLRWVILIPVVGAAVSIVFLTVALASPGLLKQLFRLIPSKRLAVFMLRSFLIFKGRLFGKDWKIPAVFVSGALLMGVLNAVNFGLNLHVAGVPSELITPGNLTVFVLLVAVVMFVPSAPSSVGVIHFGIYSALVVMAEIEGFAITQELKDTFVFTSVLFHLCYFIPETLLGAFFVIKERRVIFSMRSTEPLG